MTRPEELEKVARVVADFIRTEGVRLPYGDLRITVRLDAKRPPSVELGTARKVRLGEASGAGL